MHTPKKILIFSMLYYPRVGGAEIAIKEITDRIDHNEYEFHMITVGADSTLPRIEKIGAVLVHRVDFFIKEKPTVDDFYRYPLKFNKWFYQFKAFFEAVKLHRKYSYDGIWAMMASGAGVPAALFKMRFPSVPYALTLQEGHTKSKIKRSMLPVYPFFVAAFKSADVIQAISKYLAGLAYDMGYKKEIVVIPNGVNLKLFATDFLPERISRIKKEIGKKDGDIFLITTSRLVYKNAIDDVVRTLVLLPTHIKFVIIGRGPDEKLLKELASELGVSDRVFFKGHIDQSNIPGYLQASDIFIRPSRSEGMGNSFVEAMAAELPVVATQEGGISDFLYDAERDPAKKPTGFAVDKDSPEQIKEAVEDIIARPEYTKEVVQNAKEMVIKQYDWDIVSNDMKHKVFDQISNVLCD